MECCICFETINHTNCITTACNHTFHANCIMKHTMCVDYTCPYCRKELVDKEFQLSVDDSDSEYDEQFSYDDAYEEYEYSHEEYSYLSNLEKYVFESFRWFNQRNNNEELEGTEEDQITFERDYVDIYNSELLIYDENKEQIQYLAKELEKAKIPYNDLLYAYITSNCEGYSNNRFGAKYENKVSSTITSIHNRIRRNNPSEFGFA